MCELQILSRSVVPLWVGLGFFVKIAFAGDRQILIKHLGDSSSKLKSIKLSKCLCIVDIFSEKRCDVS